MTAEQSPSRDSFAHFSSTPWTLIRLAQGASTGERGRLLGELIRRYWKAVYAYFRGKGRSREDAEDLVQGFLESFLAKDKILQVEQLPTSNFRDWLRVAARHFMLDQLRIEHAAKRRPPQGVASFEDLVAADGRPFEPADLDESDPFTDAWRRELLERALQDAWEVCKNQNRLVDYQIFVDYYCRNELSRQTWKDVAQRYQLDDGKIAARKAEWVKSRVREAIRNNIRCYVNDESEIDDEIFDLLG